jgi:hypothetical protein
MAQLDAIEEFRQDHRKVRDGLLSMATALGQNEVAKAREILGGLNALVGPHFRYEEEALYPAMKQFLGEYVDQLFEEHDGVIKTAKDCVQLLSKDSLSQQEADEAIKATRALLIHVSNCDGLAILTERLTSQELSALADKYSQTRKEGVPLLDWADSVRKR